VFKTRAIEIRDDHHRRAEQECRGCGRKSNRACAGDQHSRAGRYVRADASVIAGRQNIAKAGQVPDFSERLISVRKLEQVPIGIRHHHIFGLSPNPTAKIDVAIRATRSTRVHIEADVGTALFAVAASSA